jgi:hypothetical protein
MNLDFVRYLPGLLLKEKIFVIIVFIITFSFVVAAVSECGDVKVLIGIGLLDEGEYLKLITVKEYYKYKSDYEEFRDLLKRAVTLREMVNDGWSTVHVEPMHEGYHVFIFEK